MKSLAPLLFTSFAFVAFAPLAAAQGGVTRFCTPGTNGSVITAAGSADFTVAGGSGDLVLHASNVPAGNFGLFFYGSAQIAPTPLGNGTRCVGGTLLRLPVVQAQAGQPTVAFPVDYLAPQSAAGPIAPGSTWNFQFLFRTGATFDLSDAIGIHFGLPEPTGFTTLLQGPRTGHPTGWQFEGGTQVVTDAASWTAFWNLHTTGMTPQPPEPAVDFAQNAVLAVFAGRKLSGGHSVAVKRVGLSIATLGVTSVERQPAPGCGSTFGEQQPFHFVLVPHVDHLVGGAWTKVVDVYTCP
ncbi:MAG: protease complex subunit PrcB family protein [Planctomycetota bacterium]